MSRKRLSKKAPLTRKEVEVFPRRDDCTVREKNGDMVRAFDLLASLPDDLAIPDRKTDRPQKRKGL